MYTDIFFTVFFFTVVIVICIGFIVSLTRKGSWALKVRPQIITSFSTTVSPEKALTSIVRFAHSSGYKVSNLDETVNRVVLEEPLSFWGWGFFFPIFLVKQPDSLTSISVGIKSKFIQYGPIVHRSHSRCINGIKNSLAE
jgi:hypothetical protein